MNGETIKSFLVGLGFGVDDASLAKFNKAIQSASIKVAALYGGIQLASAGIFAGIAKMSEGFENIGYELRLVAPAVNKMLLLRQAMLSAYRAAGIDLTKVVKESIAFNFSLAKTKFALEAVYKSVGAKFIPRLTKQMDIFRSKIFANMPKIQESLMKFVDFLFRAFDGTVQLGARILEILGRVWDFFKKLDDITGGWSTKILGLIAIWKILNLGFLATPLGMLLTGILALIALYDDFKVWQEGGKALIDWGSRMTTTIVGVTTAVGALALGIGAIGTAIGVVTGVIRIATIAQYAWNLAMSLNPIGLVIAGVAALIGLITLLAIKIKPVGDFFSNLGNKFLGFFGGTGPTDQSINGVGGSQSSPVLANALSNVMNPQPLGQQSGGGISQKVQQETNINIQGSSDANAVGKAVASEQNKVNFDMSRNLKGAMR